MSNKWMKELEVVDAESEDGRQFRIHINQTMIETGKQNEPPLEGLKVARTSEGDACNFIDDATWEIVNFGIIVKRV